MPRIARIVLPGLPHHITQRGNNGQSVFDSDADYQKYLTLLFEQSEKFSLAIEGYSLMPNHVHIIATPDRKDSLAHAVGRTNLIYAQYFNTRHGRSGHLWQSRFYSCAMDEPHFCAAIRYVELNPLRAGIAQIPWQFRWSSAAAHCGIHDDNRRLDFSRWEMSFNGEEWKQFLSAGVDDDMLKKIADATMTGRPFGGEDFVNRMETSLGRPLRPKPVGRPKRQSAPANDGSARRSAEQHADHKRLADFARPWYAGKDPAHDFEHIERIIRLIGPLSEGVKPTVRPRLLSFLACFHGLAGELKENEAFQEQTNAFLGNLGWLPGEIDEALEALHRHVDAPQTSEEEVVHDANYAETLGALGVAKAFTTGGARRQSYRETMDIFERRILTDVTFYTPAGKRLATQAGRFARDFVRRLRSELAPH